LSALCSPRHTAGGYASLASLDETAPRPSRCGAPFTKRTTEHASHGLPFGATRSRPFSLSFCDARLRDRGGDAPPAGESGSHILSIRFILSKRLGCGERITPTGFWFHLAGESYTHYKPLNQEGFLSLLISYRYPNEEPGEEGNYRERTARSSISRTLFAFGVRSGFPTICSMTTGSTAETTVFWSSFS